ncbi:hypothetical protein HIM_08299 [Hirsutella minnesotensis 3608]|uniref:6-phosphogluconolactonase n=1 Tax=Hirsutella minnesotensis 3608 TaxID=1043627 RepID=A0A0F7ZT02_9HYPO|nr:hypothetical protein HIM_08299 [Hirsutella minnesotensis 3608]
MPCFSFAALFLGAAVVSAQAVPSDLKPLYVSSWSGKVTTLGHCGPKSAAGGDGAIPVLKTLSETTLGGVQSFLRMNANNSILYSVDEGWQSQSGNGTLHALQVKPDGSLQPLGKQETAPGPVFMEFIDGQTNMAIPHFGGRAVSVLNVADPANMTQVQKETFELKQPGPKPQQNEAKPHQTLVDPTGKFLVAPDLGADLIRIFALGAPTGNSSSPQNNQEKLLRPLEPAKVDAGSGPRHAAFAVADNKTYLYVVTELSSELMGFRVLYDAGSMNLLQIFKMKVHGKDASKTPEFAAASEVAISPDNQFLLVASRNESSLRIPNFDPKNTTELVSDPISNYKIDTATGELEELQIKVPSGGFFPRHFSMNKDGSRVAVANQQDSRIVIIERDPKSGMLGKFLGHATLEGPVTSVIFSE